MRALGIDYGTEKVGVALSDEALTMGFPKAVLRNDAELLSAIETLIREEEVEIVVIGESLGLSGSENPVQEKAHAFGERLAAKTGVRIAYELEAFSSQEALRDIEGVRGRGAPDDSRAAALILTSYLSRSHD